MKHRHQASLLRRVRQKLGATCEEMARMIGLSERPGAAFVSGCEHGKSKLSPKRWKLLQGVVSKEEVLDAYVQDAAESWENRYEGSTS